MLTSIATLLAYALGLLPLAAGGLVAGWAWSRGSRVAHAQAVSALAIAKWIAWSAFWLAVAAALIGFIAGAAQQSIGTGPLRLDGLGLLLALLVSFVWGIVASFSQRYMRAEERLAAYAGELSLLGALALTMVLSNSLALLGATWLATGFVLISLVKHRRDWAQAQAAARRMRTTFLIGDVSFLTGLALIGWAAGTDKLTEAASAAVHTAGAAGATDYLILAALILLLIGAMTRSAILPVGNWLLSSMTAPTPVSAMMHAGLVNVGGFVLARFAGAYLAAPEVLMAAFLLGAATALWGTLIMLVRGDAKTALGASTMGQMGFMMMQAGLGAFAHAILHVIAHGLFKAALFLGVPGTVGKRHSPLGKPSTLVAALIPLIAATALLGIALLAGAPLASPATLLGAFAILTVGYSFGVTFKARLRHVALGVALTIAAFAVYLGLLGLVTIALPAELAEGRPIGLLEWSVFALFIAAWVVQQVLSAVTPDKRPAAFNRIWDRIWLPLYVRLVNAGRLDWRAHQPTASASLSPWR